MTLSWLGRLFTVPLLIIGAIVGGAVIVVLLFGGLASPQARSIDDLLQMLEANSGERSLGVLLPREKELWQTALELSIRLENKHQEAELTEEKMISVTARLATMIRADLESLDRIVTTGSDRQAHRNVRSRRFEFLIRALGGTERPEAVEVLVDIVGRGREPYAQVAMQMLGDLHAIPSTRQAIEPMVALLRTATMVETRLVACTALSVLATGDDQPVIDALAEPLRSAEGELAWSAALALARLGSDLGRETLLDLMDRPFLASGDRYEALDDAGQVRRYPMPPQRVDALMIAAIDAVSNLDDKDLWKTIEGLQSDRAPAVRAKAAEAVAQRNKQVVSP